MLGGDSAGWNEARLGLAFQRTALRLRCPRPKPRARNADAPDLPVLQAANCACLALSLDDPHAEELLAAFAGLPDSSFGAGDAYPLFVRELLRLRDGGRVNVSPRLEVYGDVLQLWSGDPSVLARRLAALLDHHLDRTQGSPGKPAEFDEPGVMLYPAEVLAVRAIRHDLGLPWPKVEHALMFTNLATMVPGGPWPKDALLHRIEQRVDR